MNALPLVSILITAYNRPHYLSLALQSALDQGYPNIEIIISDNSTTDEVEQMLEPYLERHSHLRYHRNIDSISPLDNFKQSLRLASGDYIAYLMDDDLFAPQKVEQMVGAFARYPRASLVTSHRQVINEHGQMLPDIDATRRMCLVEAEIEGQALSRYVLENMFNCVGEPTTPMFKHALMDPERLGSYLGRQTVMLSDIATWLELARVGSMVYLPDSLSFFRLHAEQGQRLASTILHSLNEWVDLACDAFVEGILSAESLELAWVTWVSRLPGEVAKMAQDKSPHDAHQAKHFSVNCEVGVPFARRVLKHAEMANKMARSSA